MSEQLRVKAKTTYDLKVSFSSPQELVLLSKILLLGKTLLPDEVLDSVAYKNLVENITNPLYDYIGSNADSQMISCYNNLQSVIWLDEKFNKGMHADSPNSVPPTKYKDKKSNTSVPTYASLNAMMDDMIAKQERGFKLRDQSTGTCD